jgi:hypothetical protein
MRELSIARTANTNQFFVRIVCGDNSTQKAISTFNIDIEHIQGDDQKEMTKQIQIREKNNYPFLKCLFLTSYVKWMTFLMCSMRPELVCRYATIANIKL